MATTSVTALTATWGSVPATGTRTSGVQATWPGFCTMPGCMVICAFISPVEALRDAVRGLFPEGAFREVYVKCDIKECIQRDPKGLYAKALNGEIKEFTGISAPYEAPRDPETTIDTTQLSPDEAVRMLIDSIGRD